MTSAQKHTAPHSPCNTVCAAVDSGRHHPANSSHPAPNMARIPPNEPTWRARLKERQRAVRGIEQLLPVLRHEVAKLQGLPQPPLIPRVAMRRQQGVCVAADPMAQPHALWQQQGVAARCCMRQSNQHVAAFFNARTFP